MTALAFLFLVRETVSFTLYSRPISDFLKKFPTSKFRINLLTFFFFLMFQHI